MTTINITNSTVNFNVFVIMPDPGDGKGPYVEVPLGGNNHRVTKVSPEDAARVIEAGPWFADQRSHTTYAYRNIRKPNGQRTTERLHRFLLGGLEGLEVDHDNFDGLDNRRLNLKPVTQKNNLRKRKGPQASSTTRLRGVSQSGPGFRANVRVDGKLVWSATVPDREEAALEADAMRLEHYGEYCGTLNIDLHPELIDWADEHGVEVDPRLRARVEGVGPDEYDEYDIAA